ncbi:MAG: hypothetical protein WCW14_00535, partial [Candidatus Paceibacterota bacterium]
SLKGHELTVVGTYDEAQAALLPNLDREKQKRIFAKKFGDNDPYKRDGITDEVRQQRMDYFYSVEREATSYPNFDVVLTDLLVPASQQAQGPDGSRYVGQEMPLGTTIALLALVAGVKKVAVVTDMNHHNHPASAAFDCFGNTNKPGANIICTNRVGEVAIDEATGEPVDQQFLKSDEGKKKYPYPEGKTWGDRKGLSWGKDWGNILIQLIGEEAAE